MKQDALQMLFDFARGIEFCVLLILACLCVFTLGLVVIKMLDKLISLFFDQPEPKDKDFLKKLKVRL